MRQKLAAHAPLLLLLLQLFLPLCFLVTRLFGYRTEVTSCPLHAALLAGATLFLTWLAVRHGEDTPWASALAAALLPTAAVAQSLVLLALGVGTRGSWSGPLFALVYGVCAWILLARHARPKALAVGASILSAALTLGLIFLGFIFMVFGSLGERSVMQTLSSPDGRYTAQVIDSDEGALGGATFVEIGRASCRERV